MGSGRQAHRQRADELVEEAEIEPRVHILRVQLHRADVRLQRVHQLALLLVQHTARPTRRKHYVTLIISPVLHR